MDNEQMERLLRQARQEQPEEGQAARQMDPTVKRERQRFLQDETAEADRLESLERMLDWMDEQIARRAGEERYIP